MQEKLIKGAQPSRSTELRSEQTSAFISGDGIEALFLKSLSDGAADFVSAAREDRWAQLTERCRSDLNLDNDAFSYLFEDVKKKRYRTIVFMTLMKTWWRTRRTLFSSLSKRPRIALILPDGQSIRTFLLTDVCRKLAAWADLIVLSPFEIESEVARLGPHAMFLPIPLLHRNHFDHLVGYLGYLQTESPTSRKFAERLEENFSKARADGSPIEGSLRIWEIARSFRDPDDYLRVYCSSLRIFAHAFILKEAISLLRMINADVVFNASLISWSSRMWTRAAALAGIPTVSNVISWDNMSTKTLLDEFVDTFLIWSHEMDEDFTTSLPFVRGKRRVIVGSPQFEPVIEGKDLLSRGEFLQAYGLDPDKKLILYTTGSKSLFPREPDCLDCLLDHWRSKLKDRANIMVRMHPNDRHSRYDVVRAKFPEVPFTFAGQTLADDDKWIPTREDVGLLVNQLNHCDMIINVASTMTLEGFAVDKPCINIGFSLGLSLNARYPMDDYYKSRHYRDIVESGAARLVEDYEQLFQAIDDVLDGNGYDRELQRRLLQKKCRYTRDASTRIDNFLKDFVPRNRPHRGLRCVAATRDFLTLPIRFAFSMIPAVSGKR